MKMTSVDSVALVNNITSEKMTKTGNSGQVGTSFSSIIDGISSTNLSNENPSDSITSTDNTASENAKKTINTAIKDKLEDCESKSEETAQVDKQDNAQNVTTEIKTDEKLDLKDSLEEVSEEIKNILLDILKISEEDLEAAMQVLGLEYLDCLDKTNLAELLMQISGKSDISVLITDETLYQQFNETLTLVDGVKQDILASLGITEDELMATLEQINLSEQAEVVTAQTKDLKVQDVSVKESSSIVEIVKESVSVNVVSKEQETSVKQEKDIANVVEEITSETTDKVKTVTTNTQDDGQQQAANKDTLATKQSDTIKQSATLSDNQQEYSLMQQKQESVVNNNIGEIVPINEKTSIDAESIVKQIQNQLQNQIKVSANIDTTAMEFQLNPEHLGKLTIHLASKEGIITAQITTQNLAIKEVLESQIIQLRENMTNQGLKVDAVEVTIESHEFERNLEEGNSNKNQEQFEQQGKNSRRQFNYNDLDSLEDLSAEEALVAQMMIGNGNSINYTA